MPSGATLTGTVSPSGLVISTLTGPKTVTRILRPFAGKEVRIIIEEIDYEDGD